MQTTAIEITQATTADVESLRKISIETFRESFSDANSVEDMDLYLEKSFNEAVLLDELKNPFIQYYLVLSHRQVIGYLKLNFGETQTELKDQRSFEIERIYVRKIFQGQKIGQALLEFALSIAGEEQLDYIWLGVWEKNPGAIRFYKRNGFVQFDKHVFKLGNDIQTDLMMKLHLTQK